MLKNLLFLRIPILFLLLLTASTAILFNTPTNFDVRLVDLFFKTLPSIIFTITLIILTYIWSHQLLGGWWAVLPPFLLTFSPNIINQHYYVLKTAAKKGFFNLHSYQIYEHTTDITAAFFYTITIYYLIKFFLKPSKWHLFLAGLNFGLSQLTGSPAFILIPYFLILISVFYIASIKRDWLTTEPLARFKRFGLRGFRYFRSIIIIFIIGFLFAYIAYLFYEVLYSISHTTFDFGNEPSWKYILLQRPLNDYFQVISTKPEIDYYIQIISILKTYWLFVILTASALIYSLINIIKSFRGSKFKGFFDYLGTSFPEFSMIVFTIIYGGFVIFTSGFNINKLMPVLPMIYILTASGLKRLLMNK